MSGADDVGILALEVYFPRTYVDQEDLEAFDKIAKGKYTKGLGQLRMAAFSDLEDVNSLALTVVDRLMQKNGVDPRRVGRLEVGTETIVDKSKSSKTVLMQLFTPTGNSNVEGLTTYNACYGGVQALFNTVAWVQSAAWDGRLGIVVCTDIALYAKGPARATGGGGAVACLIGPGATIVLDPLRASYFENTYDFYKPIPNSEYPIVAGHYSQECYMRAIASCFDLLKQKLGVTQLEDLGDFFCFHTPYLKMAMKGFNRVVFEDLKANAGKKDRDERLRAIPSLSFKNHYAEVERYSRPLWSQRVVPGTLLCQNLGNLYTGSVFICLAALLCNERVELPNKRIMLFAYGSGLASSMFRLTVKPNAQATLAQIRANNPIQHLLDSRVKLTPEEYTRRMDKRDEDYNKCNWLPGDSLEELADGTYYLLKVDEKWRRTYAKKAAAPAPRL